MSPRCAIAVSVVSLAWCFAPGCAAPTIDPAAPGDHRLSLTLWARTTSLRITYFELAEDGALAFSGGRQAGQRIAAPAGSITPQDRQALLRLIARRRLLEAPGDWFARETSVVYEGAISVDGHRHSFRCVDGQAPGLAELHDLLAAMQARNRYGPPATAP